MELSYTIFSIAAIFSPLAAVAAFLITYKEYAHHYANKRKVLRAAIEVTIFTLVFFLGLGLLLAVIIPFCI
ncbi:MAG: hypothetical protein A2173_10990 [Planctomycetes bacterium RBG_13_44_8b]|nr:MAG: hypothetical protein A2173_10990 [Planctomycetes bacterium RBG_13_44_8b]